MKPPADPEWLTPGEVAVMFRVDPRTVGRWRTKGLIKPADVIRTLGGHRRYRTAALHAIATAERQEP